MPMHDDCDNANMTLRCLNDNADDNDKDDWSHNNNAACFGGKRPQGGWCSTMVTGIMANDVP